MSSDENKTHHISSWINENCSCHFRGKFSSPTPMMWKRSTPHWAYHNFCSDSWGSKTYSRNQHHGRRSDCDSCPGTRIQCVIAIAYQEMFTQINANISWLCFSKMYWYGACQAIELGSAHHLQVLRFEIPDHNSWIICKVEWYWLDWFQVHSCTFLRCT